MTTRTLVVIGGILVVAALVFGGLSTALAQTPWGTTGWGTGWGPSGMMGGGGMMGGSYGRGGMMGGGSGSGYGPGGMMGGWGTTGTGTPLRSLAEAQQAFQAYLTRLGNANLALDEVMEFEQNYYAIIEERSSGRGAFEVLADKQTGAVFPEPGPNMMWNTTYGHMGGRGRGMMGGWTTPNGAATVTPERATALAQQWLDANQPGSATEAPDVFPGYYTLHITRDGKVTGMLSVHAVTGQVWFHAWHGAFMASTDAGH